MAILYSFLRSFSRSCWNKTASFSYTRVKKPGGARYPREQRVLESSKLGSAWIAPS